MSFFSLARIWPASAFCGYPPQPNQKGKKGTSLFCGILLTVSWFFSEPASTSNKGPAKDQQAVLLHASVVVHTPLSNPSCNSTHRELCTVSSLVTPSILLPPPALSKRSQIRFFRCTDPTSSISSQRAAPSLITRPNSFVSYPPFLQSTHWAFVLPFAFCLPPPIFSLLLLPGHPSTHLLRLNCHHRHSLGPGSYCISWGHWSYLP